MDPVIARYIDAYEAFHGRTPRIIKHAGGWYRVNGGERPYRKKKLVIMARNLRERAKAKDPQK